MISVGDLVLFSFGGTTWKMVPATVVKPIGQAQEEGSSPSILTKRSKPCGATAILYFSVESSGAVVKPHASRLKARSPKLGPPAIWAEGRSSILRLQNTSDDYSGRFCGRCAESCPT